MADINNNDIWIDVETLAKLKILHAEQFDLR